MKNGEGEFQDEEDFSIVEYIVTVLGSQRLWGRVDKTKANKFGDNNKQNYCD
jgi:hypothetical protein